MTTRGKILLLSLILLLSTWSIPTYAQKNKGKAKSHRLYKIRNSSSNNEDNYNGHTIYTGPRGGRYYINRNGNKTYI